MALGGVLASLRRHRTLLAPLVAGGILLAACGGTGDFDFVGSPDRKAFFKVPLEWKQFNKRNLLIASGQSLNTATDERLPWLIAFDAAPNPSINHVLDFSEAPQHPVVLAQAISLDFGARDQLSLGSIRNAVYPIDELLDQDQASILNYEEITLDEGFRGIKIEYDVITQGIIPVVSGNTVIRVTQVGVTDPETETLYLLLVRCESHCYRDHQALISQITDSWTVKER